MEFEWDAKKAAANRRKHRVSFEEATSVFGDSLAVSYLDPEHSVGDVRFLTFGLSKELRLLVVSHVERQSRVHIVSAREATKHERKIYEDG